AALDLLVESKGMKNAEELSKPDEAEVIKSLKIVTGQNVLFVKYLEQHLQELQLDQKTIDAKRRQILRYSKEIPILSDSTRSSVRAYTRHLSKNENLKNKTIHRDLSNLSVYWEYLRDELQVLAPDADNPFKGQALPKEDSKALLINSRLAFSINDISKLDEALKSNNTHPEDYEIFLIAIYTGARREEIGQLKLKDIHVNNTKEVISMEIEAAKTKASNRIIPIHPNIASMISKKIEHLNDDDAYIFKTLRNNKYGKRTDALGKRFGRLKEALGFGERYVFHSIRKTVTTLLEQAGVAEGITADIVGHEKQTMTYGLYSGGTSMEQKTDAIKRIDYGIHKGK
ncbi:tyrosine-type recombinase/integrase, partial [Amylibacter sp.]|nr:tyrosine-type recombinase/integrase [Amylibacter sp.]